MKEIAESTAKSIFSRWIDNQENKEWLNEFPTKHELVIAEIAKEIRCAILLVKFKDN